MPFSNIATALQTVNNRSQSHLFSEHLPYMKETMYAKIEKEIVSIIFGTERISEYPYGHQFTVFNDHQPLKPIFNKSIALL